MSRSRHRVPRSPLKASIVLLGVGLAMFWAASSGTLSAWTSAGVTNSTNTTGSKTLAFTHAYQSTSCSQGIRTSVTTSCSGSIAPTAATPSSGSITGTDTITNNGTYGASQLESAFSAPSCAPVKFDNSKTTGDPMLARYGTAFQQPDKWASTSAVSLTGTGYATDATATNTATLLGGNYSIGVWFKVANGYASGGALMGLSASPSNATSAASSPLIWMGNNGKISYRISGTLGAATGTSSAAYNNGSWHFVVISVGTLGISMYVDSASAVSSLALSALTGGNAYWHLGWGDFTGVSGPPTSSYLTGSLSGAFVTASALTGTNRTTLLGATSAADYLSKALATSNISHVWMLGDPGTTTFTGTLPSSMTAPCSMVNIAWATTNPAGTVTSSTPLSSFANGSAKVVAAPAPGASQTSTITTSRGGTYNTDISGLHLYAPITHTVQTKPTPSAWKQLFTWAGPESAFIG